MIGAERWNALKMIGAGGVTGICHPSTPGVKEHRRPKGGGARWLAKGRRPKGGEQKERRRPKGGVATGNVMITE